jgi:hypothetical protein
MGRAMVMESKDYALERGSTQPTKVIKSSIHQRHYDLTLISIC